MADLVEWLRTQLDADAAPIPMPAWHEGWCMEMYVEDGTCLTCGGEEDPANVTYQERSPQALREVEAKRGLLALHTPSELGTWVGDDDDREPACATCGDLTTWFPCRTLRLLASVYADRPGYQEGWAP